MPLGGGKGGMPCGGGKGMGGAPRPPGGARGPIVSTLMARKWER